MIKYFTLLFFTVISVTLRLSPHCAEVKSYAKTIYGLFIEERRLLIYKIQRFVAICALQVRHHLLLRHYSIVIWFLLSICYLNVFILTEINLPERFCRSSTMNPSSQAFKHKTSHDTEREFGGTLGESEQTRLSYQTSQYFHCHLYKHLSYTG